MAGRKKTTLDAIGKEFGVTRERIRQIEAASLGKLKKLSKLDHNIVIFKKVRSIIEANGGIIDEKTLVDNLILDLEAHREEEIKKINKAYNRLEQRLGRPPELEDLKIGQ